MKRAVITVAVGKTYYLNLARNLLRSFLLWNKNSEIYFLLLTDNSSYFKEFQENPQVHLVTLELEDSEKSFTSKFLLFDHLKAEENLFIDCDCLIYGSLVPVFEKMRGYNFTAIGKEINSGDFFCNVSEITKKFNIPSIPWFVGSVYYFKNSETTMNIIHHAKELKKKYDNLGFIRLRGKENEEPLLSVSMSVYNQKTVKDDGCIKADRMFFDFCKSNILKGKATLTSKNTSPSDTKANLLLATPIIVHFNDSFSETSEYLAEEYRLNHLNHSTLLIEAFIFINYTLKTYLIKTFKNIFRPIFRRLIGPLKVKTNKRVSN